MSVTFCLSGAKYYSVPNPEYIPEEPEDFIFNPKSLLEPIYPEMNLANMNAGALLNCLDEYDQELYGRVLNKDLPAFIDKIVKLEKVNTTTSHLKDYLPRLKKISNIAKELGDDLVWS